jgi:phage terminase large subunit-like protein
MAQRRHHYESAFEDYLRSRRIPYVAVNEAKKSLLPDGVHPRLTAPADGDKPQSLKSFDFVLYGSGGHDAVNLLVEVKGRKIARRGGKPSPKSGAGHPARERSLFAIPTPRSRLDSWVTQDDVASLAAWERLFGEGFQAAFVFVYWCDEQPPDGLYQEIIEHRGRWYAIRVVTLAAYTAAMRPRSVRWRTVHVPATDFELISQPLTVPFSSLPAAGRRSDPIPDPGPQVPALEPIEPGGLPLIRR